MLYIVSKCQSLKEPLFCKNSLNQSCLYTTDVALEKRTVYCVLKAQNYVQNMGGVVETRTILLYTKYGNMFKIPIHLRDNILQL